MLHSLSVRGFKSLYDVQELELGDFTLVFGPNAAGKSNLIDAILLVSRLATERTISDALGKSSPVRGRPLEAFSFPDGGLPGLFDLPQPPEFSFDVSLACAEERFRYSTTVSISPASGEMSVSNEHLAQLTTSWQPYKNRYPYIERQGTNLLVRKRRVQGRPEQYPADLNHTLLSDERLSGEHYFPIETVRNELASFRTYYLDPRTAMRAEESPQEVNDIGPRGENLAAFLYRLRETEPSRYRSIQRNLGTIIPAVDDLQVELDRRRGTVDVEITQDGIPFSSRIVSEGTLRVLGLLCVAANPWGGSLLAFEEPENGVHPRRVELTARVLATLPERGRQVIVTSHSPLFCGYVVELARQRGKSVRMYRAARDGASTVFQQFNPSGALFDDAEIRKALASQSADAVFEELTLRGLLDG